MITIRKSADRGPTKFDWLDSLHTFSFGHYRDPKNMGFGPLRVINEDWVAPGGGFPTHPHDNMEILTYIMDGALEHKDSIGAGSVIRPGDVQRMSAGTGVTHSEFNHSKTESVHLLQIWIIPEKRGIKPSYEQKRFEDADKRGQLKLVASRDAREGSVTFHQDVDMYASLLNGADAVTHTLKSGRIAWVQVAKGELQLNGKTLKTGDGAAIKDESILNFTNANHAEIILFDMAA